MVFKKRYLLNSFKPGIENFAVILKGKSIERISEVYENYNECFLVNNFYTNSTYWLSGYASVFSAPLIPS